MAPITDQGASEKTKRPPSTTKSAQTASTQGYRAIGNLQHRTVSENASENGPQRAKINEGTADAKFSNNAPSQRANVTQHKGPPNSWWDATEEEYEAVKASDHIRAEQLARLQSLFDDDIKPADGFQKSRKTARSPPQREAYPISHTTTEGRFSLLSNADDDADESEDELAAMPKSARNGPNNETATAKDKTGRNAPPTTTSALVKGHEMNEQSEETSCEDAYLLALRAFEQVQSEYTERKMENPSFTEATIPREFLRTIGYALLHAHQHLQRSLKVNSDSDNNAARFAAIERSIDELKTLVAASSNRGNDSNATATPEARRTETTQPRGTQAPRTYAAAASTTPGTHTTSSTAPPRRAKVKALRKDQAASNRKNAVTLSTRHASDEAKEAIANMPHHAIAEKLQTAITKEILKAAKGEPPKVVGIGKLENGIRIQLESEEDANAIPINDINWSEALGTTTGIKPHAPSYAIVIHDLHLSNSSGIAPERSLRQVEIDNNMASGTINKITNLYRIPRNRAAVIMYLNCPHQANKCIKEGIYVKYVYYRSVERFFPQTQITQCYNCHGYGHQATNCTVPTRCGWCGDKHETKECKATTPKCLHCHEGHEAWNIKCEVRIAERERGKKKLERLPIFFSEVR
jgi:hypothetical protein